MPICRFLSLVDEAQISHMFFLCPILILLIYSHKQTDIKPFSVRDKN